jgi:formyl-CoA transferase/CoA:oxalate CoA-transferase
MLLGDLGADVVKVERPGGDGFRSWGAQDGGDGSAFLQLNRNKRSIVLDLKKPEDQEAARQLALQFDVVVENYRPGVMQKAGLSYERLREIHPRLIYCSISGYGQTGPLKDRGGFDLILQGHGGVMSVTGQPGQPPVKAGVPIIDFGASAHAAIGILAAYLGRKETGRGQFVDVSLLDVPVSWLGLLAAKYWATGEVSSAMGSAHPLSSPYQGFATADGYVTIAAGNQSLWASTCRALGLEHLLDDPRFVDNDTRARNQTELVPLIEAVLSTQGTQYWIDWIAAHGVPCGPIYTVDQVLSDPQVLHRNMVLELEHPRLGKINVIGSPIKLSETPVTMRRPPPALGEHTAEVAAEFNLPTLAQSAAGSAAMEKRGVRTVAE